MGQSGLGKWAIFALLLGAGAHPAVTQNPRIVPTPRPIVGELPPSPAEQYLPQPAGIRVETWQEGTLVGGLYGVALGGAFFGESMFHRVTDASKVAMVALVERLRERGFILLDTQWVTDHLVQFGAIEIPRRRYLRLLESALRVQARFA